MTNPLFWGAVTDIILGSTIISAWMRHESNTLAIAFANGASLTIFNPFTLQPHGVKPCVLEDQDIVLCRESAEIFELGTASTLLQVDLRNPDPEAMIFGMPQGATSNRFSYIVWNE
ncbi:MAG: hypothetical protein KGS72_04615 [Cyanobacteria bacterium REEB67]|nr:hypothetical protein [Cyanobacteria bacterium REEB67]